MQFYMQYSNLIVMDKKKNNIICKEKDKILHYDHPKKKYPKLPQKKLAYLFGDGHKIE